MEPRPAALGGFNLTPAKVLATCAFLAALIATEKQVLALRPSAGSWFADQRQKAVALLHQLFPSSAKPPELKATTTQRDLVHAVMEARWQVLLDEADTRTKALMRTQRQEHTWAWKTAPALPEFMMESSEFQVLVRKSLGVPLLPKPIPCPAGCGHQLDLHCDHAYHCSNLGHPIWRHDAGVRLFAQEFKSALLSCSHEQTVDTSKAGDSYRPDLISEPLPGLTSRDTAYDLTVVNPFSDSMLNMAANKDLAAALDGAATKNRLYEDLMHERGLDFVPLAFEATGGHAPKVAEVVHLILRQQANVSNIPFSVLTARFWRTFSVALQRSNARMILARINGSSLPTNRGQTD